MATPKVVTDGSSDLDEAVLNYFVSNPKAQVKINHFQLSFTASTNATAVSGSKDSDGEVVTGDTSWDAGDVEVDIVLTGFTNAPILLVTLVENNSTNIVTVRGSAAANTLAHIQFDDGGGTATDPDGNMVVSVLIIGY